MASSSHEDKFAWFGFSDLHSFKDYVVYVHSCAPDMFPPDDWRTSDEQMNLDRAFVGLRYGLDITVAETGKTELVDKCRVLVEEAYAEYQSGQAMEGQRKLEEVDRYISQLPSR